MHVHYYMYSTCSRRTVHQIQPHKNFVILTQFLVHLHSQPYLPYLNVLLKLYQVRTAVPALTCRAKQWKTIHVIIADKDYRSREAVPLLPVMPGPSGKRHS